MSPIAYQASDDAGMPEKKLHNGDRMNQRDFHKLYEQAVPGYKAELIDGVVYVAEPVGGQHGLHEFDLTTLAGVYRIFTPGVEGRPNSTVILNDKDEVQPDLLLRLLPNYKGQSSTAYKAQYVAGAPELVAEVADSTRWLDLNKKKHRYKKAGVIEYLVVSVSPLELHWFDFHARDKIRAGQDGVIRSHVFPGFWIHQEALLMRDSKRALEVLYEGLASPEHAKFVESFGP